MGVTFANAYRMVHSQCAFHCVNYASMKWIFAKKGQKSNYRLEKLFW